IDRETFKVFWDMSAEGTATEGLFLRIVNKEYYDEVQGNEGPHPYEWMPNFRKLEKGELPDGIVDGVEFETVTIDVPAYLLYLYTTFLGKGGKVHRASLQHISQIVTGGFGTSEPDLIVICAGIGARSLGGVEDKDMFPVRGQTVLIRAPWIKVGVGYAPKKGDWTYIIPRRSGDVILGGTRGIDDWHPHPRPSTTSEILTRTLAVHPSLLPASTLASIKASGRSPTIQDLEPQIIESGCGLRPGRKGGIRLEKGELEVDGGKVKVVYNYG
ncbi:FAD-linked reductase, partial [Sistotremastrum niveocremeum HHB9708]